MLPLVLSARRTLLRVSFFQSARHDRRQWKGWKTRHRLRLSPQFPLKPHVRDEPRPTAAQNRPVIGLSSKKSIRSFAFAKPPFQNLAQPSLSDLIIRTGTMEPSSVLAQQPHPTSHPPPCNNEPSTPYASSRNGTSNGGMDCAAQIAQKDSQAQDIRAQLLAAKKEWVPGYTMNGMTREELDQDTSICDLTRSLLLREYAPQRSEAWLLLRQVQVLVTGTSVGPICGDQGQYSTRKNVFEDKCGLRAPFVGNRFTEHGTKYEPEAIALYEKTYNTRVFETGIILHPEHPFIGVSPDGITGNGRLIEVKCPARRAIRDEVPLCYVPQLQLTMAVLDLDSIDFVQYRPPEMGRNMKDEDVVLRKAVFSVTRVARVPDWLESRLFTLVYFQTEVLNHKDQDPEWFQRAKEWREWQLKKEENKALYCSQTPPLVAKLLERKAMREYDPIGAFECAVIERPPRPKKRRFGHSTLYLTPEHKYVISSISPEQLQYYAKDFESLC